MALVLATLVLDASAQGDLNLGELLLDASLQRPPPRLGALEAQSVSATPTGRFSFLIPSQPVMTTRVGPLYMTEAAPATYTATPSGGAQLTGFAQKTFILNGNTTSDFVKYVVDPTSGGAGLTGAAPCSSVRLSRYEIYPLGGIKLTAAATVGWNWSKFGPSGGCQLTGSATVTSKTASIGAISQTLPALTGSSSLVLNLPTVSATLPAFTAAGSIEPLPYIRATLPSGASMSGLAWLPLVGEISSAVPVLETAISGYVVLVADASGALPVLEGALAGGESSIDAEMPLLSTDAQGVLGVSAAVDGTLPRISAALNPLGGSFAAVTASLPAMDSDVLVRLGTYGLVVAQLPLAKAVFSPLSVVYGATNVSFNGMSCALDGYSQGSMDVASNLPRFKSSSTLKAAAWY